MRSQTEVGNRRQQRRPSNPAANCATTRLIHDSTGRDLNELLVENGLARIYGVRTLLPDGRDSRAYLARLKELEEQAKLQRRGAWRSFQIGTLRVSATHRAGRFTHNPTINRTIDLSLYAFADGWLANVAADGGGIGKVQREGGNRVGVNVVPPSRRNPAPRNPSELPPAPQKRSTTLSVGGARWVAGSGGSSRTIAESSARKRVPFAGVLRLSGCFRRRGFRRYRGTAFCGGFFVFISLGDWRDFARSAAHVERPPMRSLRRTE